jgi:peptidoglycan/xylan/chitin deacetylase (PgdA/CDA1 family)
VNLAVLMYHRARAGRHGNAPAMLAAHFEHLTRRTRNVLPGEPLEPAALNVCLSFDDAYFDFYATVFPLLQRHNLRALLAVPPAVVQEDVAAVREERLRLEPDEAFARPELGGFCTWPELGEMTDSGHVTIAAHGFTHCRLDVPEAELDHEVDAPQAVLRQRLRQPVDSFVFPYGRYGPRSLERARRKYRHVFRIGGAMNRTWDHPVLYRIDADEMTTPVSLLSAGRRLGYRARHFWNRLRRR